MGYLTKNRAMAGAAPVANTDPQPVKNEESELTVEIPQNMAITPVGEKTPQKKKPSKR